MRVVCAALALFALGEAKRARSTTRRSRENEDPMSGYADRGRDREGPRP